MVSVAFSSAFHDASAGRDSLNFHTFELALKDVDGDTSDAADPAEQRAGLAEPSKPARRGSVFMVATPPATPEAAADSLEGEQRIHHQQQQQQQQQAEPPPPPPPPPPSSSSTGKRAAAMYRQTSAHRLFRAAPPEPKRQQWKVCEKTPLAGDETASTSAAAAPMSGEDSRLRSSSWHASDNSRRSPPPPPGLEYGHNNNKNDRFFPKRIVCRDDREVLDGSDVLQQISNLTSTEPSNEREVFVGGLRESEDAVHITEEELATYFAKFGVIESVSINRDDRTQRGRGFAFVKFFQELSRNRMNPRDFHLTYMTVRRHYNDP
ncbi:RNA recognition motif. (a.k.a. RRM, RBD, or RNP domain) containing protein [Ectocarpus siliculosus]|uniref:RNA recognition motif. (A.k.a. RRM, RBD, or RNP domain) containing protein n=1 Tax=Ectocarpus siliculosus TaxID=2880 RepID=D7FM19_ECTSI|nr:RNA recognition motif. (a.k.a. RRM, RBD, or RNP domain) containing protein [Ectocarpus siliculosus]|eukprot:CBJ29844.1 RNA recognition motif. (a.k.a. RRM, RBD, or RNP domain) containing protein [Ectocarpus siliculosus]